MGEKARPARALFAMLRLGRVPSSIVSLALLGDGGHRSWTITQDNVASVAAAQDSMCLQLPDSGGLRNFPVDEDIGTLTYFGEAE